MNSYNVMKKALEDLREVDVDNLTRDVNRAIGMFRIYTPELNEFAEGLERDTLARNGGRE